MKKTIKIESKIQMNEPNEKHAGFSEEEWSNFQHEHQEYVLASLKAFDWRRENGRHIEETTMICHIPQTLHFLLQTIATMEGRHCSDVDSYVAEAIEEWLKRRGE